jgi:hypothetical protein
MSCPPGAGKRVDVAVTRRYAAAAGDADGLQQRDELRAVALLAGGQDPGDRAAPAVGSQVNLGAQPAAGTAQRLPAGPGRRIVVIRRRPRGPAPRAARAGPRRRAGAPGRRWSPR